ncbi:SIP domain-containing protein [Microbacterium atlanticum]|uniref:SIP domain-containing protein n=1 Tax=Microbacterium atlanticum TaxID=2782168 RepID=UPI001F491DA8|nr:SIP domain-containing protein [Microbacterium atlanticum]
MPAIRRCTRAMDAAAVGSIVVEVMDAAHELTIHAPAGVVVEFVHCGDRASGAALPHA